MKGKAIALEADKTAMKGNVTVIADAIAALDKKAAAALIEKREMWSTISVCHFSRHISIFILEVLLLNSYRVRINFIMGVRVFTGKK